MLLGRARLLDALASGELTVEPAPVDASVGPCNIDLHVERVETAEGGGRRPDGGGAE